MKETRLIMGMPITVEIVDLSATPRALNKVFDYFTEVDKQFSVYKQDSEISRINFGLVQVGECSEQMREIFELAEKTKKETVGYFDIQKPDGSLDPSGIVKGWAIQRAAELLHSEGYTNFYIEAGGDIQCSGTDARGEAWSVGIRSPFNLQDIVKVLYPRGAGVATSGTYIRGQHIYNPHAPGQELRDIVSLTVIGPSVLHADRFATGAFAMGRAGIQFVEALPGFEGYAIDSQGMASMTSGFEIYTHK